MPQSASPAVARREPRFVDPNREDSAGDEHDKADSSDSRRSKYVREDTGTHETLKIIDDSLEQADDEDDVDPYNTGSFNPSRNWDRRNR